MSTTKRKLALIGANGMLASAIRKLAPSEYLIQTYDLPDFDLTSRQQVLALRHSAPDIILNCAAFTNVDGCEEQRELAMRVNGGGPGLLAELANNIDAVLVHISTDFVFDGKKGRPYLEEDQPRPLSVYGKSKLEGERQILQSGLKKYFIVRTSWLYGAGGNNFVETIIRLATERKELSIVTDQLGTPTYTSDLATAIFQLLAVPPNTLPLTPYGIYHYSNEGECSWFDFATEIVVQLRTWQGVKVEHLIPIPTEGYPLPAERPKYSVMSKDKIRLAANLVIPAWQESLKAYFKQRNSKEDFS
ncbi:dTDP-4-dehydrorhamnose reductase [Geopsychrobacter electrodiphilus]|uniref:dTDP-4-dehydrorhamnose reductase n=1 Tax=Geopsychrobacter electrodiphilus TaxID=225196 RepID=UPI000378020A|nr:dTDP-4-dehydrorhamnose reductase [Geopsychrobacter electrodiphilus]